MNERDKMFAEFNKLEFSTKKLTQMESLNMSISTVKKRKQLREKGYIERKPGSGRLKIIDLQKGEFILNQLQKNEFLSAAKIRKKLIDEYEEVKISEITIHRFLKEQGYKWKGSLNRVKNEQEQKTTRLAFSKKIWIETRKSFSLVTSLVST